MSEWEIQRGSSKIRTGRQHERMQLKMLSVTFTGVLSVCLKEPLAHMMENTQRTASVLLLKLVIFSRAPGVTNPCKQSSFNSKIKLHGYITLEVSDKRNTRLKCFNQPFKVQYVRILVQNIQKLASVINRMWRVIHVHVSCSRGIYFSSHANQLAPARLCINTTW